MTQTAPPPTDHAGGMTLPDDNPRVGGVIDQLTAPVAEHHIQLIPMCLLQPSPDNPIDRMKGEDLDELAESIRSLGILEPLIVASAAAWQAHDDRLPWLEGIQYVVIAGHRRLAAAQRAYKDPEAEHFGVDHPIPCIVRDDLVGADADAAMVVENAQRKDLTPIEEAQAYARLRDRHGKTQTEIAKLVGRNQSHISKRLDLLKLPEELQAKAGTDELPIADAVAIAKHSDDPAVMKAIIKRPHYESVETAAKAAIEQKERADAIAAAKKKLAAEGITNIIKMPNWGLHNYDTPRPLKYLATDGLKTTDHIHHECHAVAVGYVYGELKIEEVCTNPTSHPECPENKRAAEQAASEARREKQRAGETKRVEARLSAVSAAVLGKHDAATTQLVDFLTYRREVEGYYGELIDSIHALTSTLSITVPDTTDDDPDGTDRDSRLCDALEAYVVTDATHLRRVVAAVVLVDEAIHAEDSYGDRQSRAAFLEWLKGRGYKLGREEAAALKAATA